MVNTNISPHERKHDVNHQYMNNTELRYNRYIKELEEIEKKRARKVKQILEIKKRLSA